MRLLTVLSSALLAVALISGTVGCGGDESSAGDSDSGSGTSGSSNNDDSSDDDSSDDDSAGGDSSDDNSSDDGSGDDGNASDDSNDDDANDDNSVGSNGDAADGEWGNLIVTFQFDGDAPAAEAIVADGQDAAVCNKENLVKEDLVVNADNGGIANVVGWLSVERGAEPPAAHPSNEEAKQEPVVLDNVGCRFEPHMVLVQTGQTLIVKNSDDIGHNAKANLVKNIDQAFSDNLPAGKQNEYTFDNAESLPMIIECTAHKWMTARLFILDHPFVGKSDADGKLVIPNLPVGKFTIRFNHEKAGNLRDVEIAGGTTSRRGEVEIEIKPGDNDLGVIKLGPALFE